MPTLVTSVCIQSVLLNPPTCWRATLPIAECRSGGLNRLTRFCCDEPAANTLPTYRSGQGISRRSSSQETLETPIRSRNRGFVSRVAIERPIGRSALSGRCSHPRRNRLEVPERICAIAKPAEPSAERHRITSWRFRNRRLTLCPTWVSVDRPIVRSSGEAARDAPSEPTATERGKRGR